jgi:hypothetical protein
MSFDIRLPIGLLFLAMGLLLAAFGALARPLAPGGVNVDLVWGGVMALFGALMLLVVRLARKGGLPPPPEN